MPNDDAAALLVRSARLTILSAQLRTTPAAFLHLKAGTDTWVGPTPSRCFDDLTHVARSIHRAADDLLAAAVKLQKQAELILSAGLCDAQVLHR